MTRREMCEEVKTRREELAECNLLIDRLQADEQDARTEGLVHVCPELQAQLRRADKARHELIRRTNVLNARLDKLNGGDE